MKVLVTGGAGYIGSHTAKILKAAGHEPVVLDNLTYGHTWAVQWGPFEQGDLADVGVPAAVSSTGTRSTRSSTSRPTRMSASR